MIWDERSSETDGQRRAMVNSALLQSLTQFRYPEVSATTAELRLVSACDEAHITHATHMAHMPHVNLPADKTFVEGQDGLIPSLNQLPMSEGKQFFLMGGKV